MPVVVVLLAARPATAAGADALMQFDDHLLRAAVIGVCHVPPFDQADVTFVESGKTIGDAAFDELWQHEDLADPVHHQENGRKADAALKHRIEVGLETARQQIVQKGCVALENELGIRRATDEELARDVVPPLNDAILGEARLGNGFEVARNRNEYIQNIRPHYHWPVVHLSIRTNRLLFDVRSMTTSASLYYCDSGDPIRDTFAQPYILWREVPVDSQVAPQIEAAMRSSPGPQEYQIIFDFMSWQETMPPRPGQVVNLVPLAYDLCLAIVRPADILPEAAGPALRIHKDTINQVVGPFPQLLELR